jgi:hypothetical protein
MVLCLDAANPKNYNLTAVEVLVVAGGGGGGTGSFNGGGGGGGGGVIYNRNFAVTPGSAITVTVGAGGSINSNGGSSVFSTITSTGGGFGGGFNGASLVGSNGGSGGGGGAPAGTGISLGGTGNTPSTSPPQGNSGGAGEHISGIHAAFGGGGGAGGIGGDFVLTPGSGIRRSDGGFGGAGSSSSISGTSVTYAGGGGGGGHTNQGGIGGIGGVGGGGSGSGPGNAVAGTPNTGGGGGGQGHSSGAAAAGGSGIVIVRYPGPQKAIGGTITSNNGDTIHTFTTSGTFTPLVATNDSAILGLSDFSGRGNFGTTVNSPTYSSANGGSLSFDGVDDYVSSFPVQISGNESKSISCFFKINTTTRSGLCGTRNGGDGWVLCVNRTSPGNLTYFHTAGSILQISAGISTNIWYNACATYDVSTAIATLYLNGIRIGSPATSFTAIISSSFNGVVGAEDVGINSKLNGNIAQVSIYNRALTAQEIQQNFNALRSRFSV